MKLLDDIDRGLLLVVLFLLGLGLVQVYSSSFIYAIEFYSDGLFFFKKQLLYSFLSILVLLFVLWIPSHHQRKLGVALWVVALLGVALTFIPSFSIKSGGAVRWIHLPLGQRFQPSELLKVTYPFIVAYWIRFIKNPHSNSYFKFLSTLIVLAPLAALLKQPDFGAVVIIGLGLFSILFVFGLKWRFIVMGFGAMIPALYYLVVKVPYRWARVEIYLDPWKDATGKGFQMIQSMLSFSSGGISGAGLGESQGKLFFLPEAHTDFTLSIFGEEWGFIGFLFITILYGYIIVRSFQISVQSTDVINKAVALGLGVTFGSSVFVNMGVAMGALPTKGLTLPFLSYGGSSLLCLSFAMAILLCIDKESRLMIKKNKKKYSRI